MIYILTGPVGSGKTSALLRLVESWRSREFGFDGFLSLRLGDEEKTLGYDLYELRDEKTQPLLRRTGRPDWPKVGDFYFVPEGLARAREIIAKSSAADLLVIDELGPVELEGGGLWPALRGILFDDRRRFLVVIRESIVEDFLSLLRPVRIEIVPLKDSARLRKIRDLPPDPNLCRE
jgi:nucleoside-triphosphatase THEP1